MKRFDKHERASELRPFQLWRAFFQWGVVLTNKIALKEWCFGTSLVIILYSNDHNTPTFVKANNVGRFLCTEGPPLMRILGLVTMLHEISC